MLQQMFQKCELQTRIKSCLKKINRREEVHHRKLGDRAQEAHLTFGCVEDKKTRLKLRLSDPPRTSKPEVCLFTQSEFSVELEALLLDFHTLMVQNSIETLFQKVPETGQFLGKLCTLAEVTSRENLFKVLMKCILLLYKQNPKTVVEVRAKEWVLSLLRICLLPESSDGEMPIDLNLTQSKISKRVVLMIRELILSKIDECHGCVKKRDLMDTSSMPCHRTCDIVGLATLMLDKWRNIAEISGLWNKILEVLSKHSDDSDVQLFFSNLIQSDIDISSQGGFFTFKGLAYLWSSYKPALENEVLKFVEDISRELPDMAEVRRRVDLHILVEYCCKDTELLLKTNQILFTLFKETNGCAVITEILSVFMECVRKRLLLPTSNHPVNSVLLLYPTSIRSVSCLLQLSPEGMGLSDILSQVGETVACLKDIIVTEGGNDELFLPYCLHHYRDWYYKVIEVILLVDRKTVGIFLDFIQYFNGPELKMADAYKECFQGILHGLRGLLGKTMLRFEDMKYVLQACDVEKSGKYRSLLVLIVTSFLCQSMSGMKFIAPVYSTIFIFMNPVERLHHLVMAYHAMRMNKQQSSSYKLEVYAGFVQENITVVRDSLNVDGVSLTDKDFYDQQTRLIKSAETVVKKHSNNIGLGQASGSKLYS